MNVTVYCGANLGNKIEYVNSAVEVGKWIAKNNHVLVYGGGKAGLMGVIADSVIENGGKTIGVIPNFLKDRELAHEDLNELIIVSSMSERKDKMFELGDVYIALPGGPGTLEEITDVISWSRIGKNTNPCIFYNADNYYNSLKQVYDDMVKADFLSSEDREKIFFSDDLQEIEKFISNYTPPNVREY